MAIIAIVGPTATGKTGWSVALAHQLGAEIISADSRLVYQGLNIGTAKPSVIEQQGVRHHMLDCVPPTDAYTVARYVSAAHPLLAGFDNPDRHVLVVGGTGLYFKQLLQAVTVPAVPPDDAFRQTVHAVDSPTLHHRLQGLDPRRASQLHPNDRTRIIRALEIIHHTGAPVPHAVAAVTLPHIHWFGLTWADRNQHRQVIADRVHAMVAQGWIAEVEALMAQHGPHAHALGMTHGYPEWRAYLTGQCPYDTALADTILQVQQYARRQRTWFTHQHPTVQWTDVGSTTIAKWLSTVQHAINRTTP
jgi:tRNA dimethylallyltransferase